MGIGTGMDQIADLFGSRISTGAQDEHALGLALAEGYNNWLHDYCGRSPRRLFAAALVPLEAVDLACQEARRAIEDLGAVGILSRPLLRNMNLDNPYHYPLYTLAEELNVPILVHGSTGIPNVHERYRTHFRRHAVNFPVSLITALMDTICGGLLERFSTLRIAFLEGAVGWVPWWLDRLDEHFEKLPSHVPQIREKPGALFRRYAQEGRVFLSCESDEAYLPFVIQEAGDDFILYASDYPHWDCIFPDSANAIARREDLSEESRRKILGANARRLLGPRFRPE